MHNMNGRRKGDSGGGWCRIARGNVDSGRGLDFQGHVLLESVMKLRGYTLETQM